MDKVGQLQRGSSSSYDLRNDVQFLEALICCTSDLATLISHCKDNIQLCGSEHLSGKDDWNACNLDRGIILRSCTKIMHFVT